MSERTADAFLSRLRRLTAARGAGSEDARLLERHLAGDEAAFAELAERHGAMALGVARRVLRDEHDAEDVLQAVFLTLARRAGRIRKPEALCGWLHGVALRLALRRRSELARQRRARPAALEPSAPTPGRLEQDELRAVFDEELDRLPERLRTPLVLCFLQEVTQEEGARRAACSLSTFRRRLDLGRERLGRRLTRRGVTLGAGLGGAVLGNASAAALPSAAAIAQTALRFAAGKPIAATTAAALAQGFLRSLAVARLKVTLLCLLAAATAGLGLGVFLDRAKPEADAGIVSRPPAVDGYGDPLPPGAFARIGTVRWRHGAAISALAFAPDGQTMATGGRDGRVRLWERATGRPLAALAGHAGVVEGAAFSPDSRLLATVGDDRSARLWDTATGQERRRSDPRFEMGAVRWSPAGQLLAAGWDPAAKAIAVWDLQADRRLAELPYQPKLPKKVGEEANRPAAHLAFAPDGQGLVVLDAGSESAPVLKQELRLWDWAGGAERFRVPAQRAIFGPSAFAFAPDGTKLAVVSRPRRGADGIGLATFDLKDGKPLPFASFSPGLTPAVAAFSPDGSLWTGDMSGHLAKAYKNPGPIEGTGGMPRTFPASSRRQNVEQIGVLAFSGDGMRYAAGVSNGMLRWGDADLGKELPQPDETESGVAFVGFGPDGASVIVGGADHAVRAWTLPQRGATERRAQPLGVFGDNAQRKVRHRSADGRLLAISEGGSTAALWDAAARRELWRQKAPVHDRVRALALSPDGRLLARSGGGVRLLDAATGQELKTLAEPNPREETHHTLLAFAPSSGRLWMLEESTAPGRAAGPHGAARIVLRAWDLPAGGETRVAEWTVAFKRPQPPQGVPTRNCSLFDFAADGTPGALLWCCESCELREAVSGKILRGLDPENGRRATTGARSADGRFLAVGDEGGGIALWSAVTGERRRVLRGHVGAVTALAFAADGRTLLSGAADTTVLAWDLAGLD